MSGQIILDVQGLRCGYGRIPVLHGVTFSVHEGEVVGVLGHNGMGKTTLMKALMGFLPATAGQVHFDGTEITRDKPHERNRLGLGYVPQGRGIFPQLSVLDNLRMGTAGRGNGNGSEADALDQVLDEFPQLERLLDRPGGALSGGEQQLLALGRCLVGEPRMILLDEPTEGIQPSIVQNIVAVLGELRKSRGVTIILVEQNLEFITELSDRVLMLQKGVITGEVAGADVKSPALVDEFVGFGAGRAASRTTAANPTRIAAITPSSIGS